MDRLFDHPGFMLYDSDPILLEVIHANWPIYPPGHGYELAIESLAVFPTNWRFQKIDEIDQCVLFIALDPDEGPPQKNVYASDLFHVAVWSEDLLELHHRGFISGLFLLTQYEAALAYYQKFKDIFVGMPLPQPDDDDCPTVVEFADDGITVTPAGAEALIALSRPVDELDQAIRVRVNPLLAIPFYDTAVREAGVILETRIREITN
jgi:hypothetical protein